MNFILKTAFIAFLTLSVYTASAQRQYDQYQPEDIYNEAITSFQNKHYGSALLLFDRYLSFSGNRNANLQHLIDAEFFATAASLYLDNSDGPARIINFVNNNPTSIYAAKANFIYANTLFKNKKYRDALKIYESITADGLPKDDASEYHFKKGYCLFQMGDAEEAEQILKTAAQTQGDYNTESSYYYAHILYVKGDYAQAETFFKRADDDPRFKDAATACLLQINHRKHYADTVASDEDQAIFDMGMNYLDDNDPRSALAAFSRLVKKNPNSPLTKKALTISERLFRENGQDEEALKIHKILEKLGDNDESEDDKTDMETLSPIDYIAKKNDDNTSNLLTAGIGSRISPLVTFRHYSVLNKKMSFGAGARHRSSWLDMNDYEPTKYMNNDIYGDFTGRFNIGQLRATADFHHDMYDICGSNDNSTTKRYNIFHAKASLNSNKTGFKSLYDEVAAEYILTNIPNSITEHAFRADGRISHSALWFDGIGSVQTIACDISLQTAGIDKNYTMLAAKPSFGIRDYSFNISLGLSLDFKTHDNIGLYPDINAHFCILDRKIEFFALMTGNTAVNTLHDIIQENPFIADNGFCLINNDKNLQYTKTKIDIRTGVKGRCNNNFDAEISIRYRKIKNDIFFVNTYNPFDTTAIDDHTFSVIFNDDDVFSLLFNAHYKFNERLNFATDIAINSHNVDNDDGNPYYKEAWYRPNFVWNLRSDFRYNDKWNFHANLGVQTGRYALNNDLNAEKLKPVVDLKIGGEYALNDDFDIYGEIGNLLHDKYCLYYDKPSYGIQFSAGMKYRF
ncbi:MAG: tetratricopeptide repeat protein [Bacteroidales bacterium]|nr:tetratricopeptide repeat protein [Bacteroidales bacterium]